MYQYSAHRNSSFCEGLHSHFLITLISLNPDQWTLRTWCLARKYFRCTQYTMNSLKLKPPTVSNVNSDCLYSELLRFPSIIGPREDKILPQQAGEREREREAKESTNEKRKERQQRTKCAKKPKSLPSGERLSGVFTRFLSDEPLEDKSEALSTMPGRGRDPLSSVVRVDRQTGRHRRWQALLSKRGKNKVRQLSPEELMAGL